MLEEMHLATWMLAAANKTDDMGRHDLAQCDMPTSNTTAKHVLNVHHGVGVLAGVGLGSTAGAGRNGHTMLPTGHVTPHWNIQGWVGVKEPKGLQKEADMLSWHNWPILNPGDVSHPK